MLNNVSIYYMQGQIYEREELGIGGNFPNPKFSGKNWKKNVRVETPRATQNSLVLLGKIVYFEYEDECFPIRDDVFLSLFKKA